MLRFVSGDLFQSEAQTLVNTVNCAGVMGKGVALAFRERYPHMYEDYLGRCEAGEIAPGVLTLYKNTEPWVLNFPTKRHWRSRSRLEDIEAGLKELVKHYEEWGIESLAMPALGCGHGGLEWSDVRALIKQHLGGLDIEIEVYEPGSDTSLASEAHAEFGDFGYETDLFGNPVRYVKGIFRSLRR